MDVMPDMELCTLEHLDMLHVLCSLQCVYVCCIVVRLVCVCSSCGIGVDSFHQSTLHVPIEMHNICQRDDTLSELKKRLGGCALVSYNLSENIICVLVSPLFIHLIAVRMSQLGVYFHNTPTHG